MSELKYGVSMIAEMILWALGLVREWLDGQRQISNGTCVQRTIYKGCRTFGQINVIIRERDQESGRKTNICGEKQQPGGGVGWIRQKVASWDERLLRVLHYQWQIYRSWVCDPDIEPSCDNRCNPTQLRWDLWRAALQRDVAPSVMFVLASK